MDPVFVIAHNMISCIKAAVKFTFTKSIILKVLAILIPFKTELDLIFQY